VRGQGNSSAGTALLAAVASECLTCPAFRASQKEILEIKLVKKTLQDCNRELLSGHVFQKYEVQDLSA